MSRKKKIDWINHLLGLVVIIFSVSLSFFLQDLREDTLEKSRNKKYLERIALDLKSDISSIEYMLEINDLSAASGDHILMLMEGTGHPSDSLLIHIGPAMYHLPLQLRASNYESIKNSGVIYSFEDSLVNRLIQHYDFDYGQIRYFTEKVYEIQHNRIYPIINSTIDLTTAEAFGGHPTENSNKEITALLRDIRLKNELLLIRTIRGYITGIATKTLQNCREILDLIQKEIE